MESSQSSKSKLLIGENFFALNKNNSFGFASKITKFGRCFSMAFRLFANETEFSKSAASLKIRTTVLNPNF